MNLAASLAERFPKAAALMLGAKKGRAGLPALPQRSRHHSVNRLQQRLGQRARVGTVDRFQGEEAAVAIHSLTASDGDAAPRGLGFLLEPNRLNVAISRAQCLSIVVGSPGLTTGLANTVEEAEQINRLCRITQQPRSDTP